MVSVSSGSNRGMVRQLTAATPATSCRLRFGSVQALGSTILPERFGRGPREMSLSSYSDVYAIDHDRDYEEEISVGDLVRTGPNLFPHFEVVAVHGEKAWVRNTANGSDHL